ncbi:sensor histidine kinase [Marivirga arenosa]|uniref:histidine kinase n=1 Tax=Marivirga arenosa TaxID=3059076 RepID=A0AA51N8G3_9BACT|nr:sensor histidine kinase [Marivirga sp. ABR2-2]WMN06435.1 sensor histidine kinase [Marivirga sp. ABR2-2]
MANRFFSIFILTFILSFSLIAQNAVFDLRDSKLNENVISLTGNWQIEFGKLLSAKQMANIDSAIYVGIPHSWSNIDQKGIDFPSTGFATYYTKVIPDQNVNQLAINGNIISTNYKIIVNDIVLGGVGKVGKSKEEAESNYQTKIYPLPKADTLEIIIQVSNYHYRKGGMTMAPKISSYINLIEEKGQNIVLAFFLIGSIFFMGLYHLGANLFRTRSKMNTYFILVCLFTILRTLSVNEYILIEYLHFPWWLSTRVELISFYLLLAFTVRFIYYLFPENIPNKLSSITYVVGIVASVITVFSPIYYSSFLVPIMQTITVIVSFGILYFLLKACCGKNKEILIALIGFLLLFAATMVEILIHHSQLVSETVFALGVFFYLFSHVIILANRQNNTYVKNLELSEELKSYNSLLEKTVNERTEELNTKNSDLIQKNEELKRINDEKNGLTHVLAHDLKSPLNNNNGLINLIKMDDSLNPQVENYISKLQKSNQQGLQLIEDLLQLYKIESQPDLEIEEINIDYFFEEVIHLHEDNARLKKVNLICDISTEAKKFKTDVKKLHRIMNNLVSNAIKFTHHNKSIFIKVSNKNSDIKIEIEDQGIGIREEEKDKLFQKFQKMSNKPTAGESSTGLGLSIVKTLVEQLSGTITFISTYGKGTTFTLSLPNL